MNYLVASMGCRNLAQRSQLNLNGYFSDYEVISRETGEPPYATMAQDTFTQNFVFYPNGMILYNFYKSEFQNRDFGYEGGMSKWGIYELENDTIKAHILTSGRYWPATPFGYVWFKLVDSLTVERLFYKPNYPITPEDVKDYVEHPPEWRVFKSEAKFVPYDSLPNPDKAWLKWKKWFWCDKEQYQDWKVNHKKR